jgi:hypothetical protein
MAPKAKPSDNRRQISCNWEGSWVTEETLADLAEAGFLPPKEDGVWRAPGDEIEPRPKPNELVMFVEHVERGFTPPGSPFFRNLLQRLGLRLHDIGPNSMLQVSNFHVLCEDYLGIAPNIDLWLASFTCNSQLVSKGGAYVQVGAISLQRHRNSCLPKLALANRPRAWQKSFFYCQDTSPEGETRLPSWSNTLFVPTEALKSKPRDSSMSFINESLIKIRALIGHGLTGLDLLSCWTKWRIQPVSPRQRSFLECTGTSADVDRIKASDWRPEDWVEFVTRVTEEKDISFDKVGLAPFSVNNKPFEVTPLLCLFAFVVESHSFS